MKAISLLSGGLDSTIATKCIKEQGIDVIALNFKSPFCLCDGKKQSGCKHMAIEMAKQIGVQIKVIYLGEEYLEIIKKPKYGYGSGINPCIDCRILKYKKAKEFMNEIGASFIITGEVLGQRPMSQNLKAMQIIEKESGLEGLIVRPLCAKVLPESIPEKEKWVNREKFFKITGRSRKEQLRLTQELKIIEYACPSGGCLLTDKFYSLKVKDLIKSNMFTVENIKFFNFGRYFRITDKFKLIIGRNELENNIIKGLLKKGDILLSPDAKGPIAAGRGEFSENEIIISCQLLSYYCRFEKDLKIKIIQLPDKENFIIINDRIEESFINKFKLEKFYETKEKNTA